MTSQAQYHAEWEVTGPGLASFEDIPAGAEFGHLGVAYCDGADPRWRGELTLGPLTTTLDCGAAGGTAANVNSFATSGGMNATLFVYATRGTKWAKVQASNLSLVSDGTETALSERATDAIRVRGADGVEQIGFSMAGTAYQVITTVGNGATDTHSVNDASVINRVMDYAGASAASGQVVGLGVASSIENIVRQNILTGIVDLEDDPNWQTVATVSGDKITFTGFAIDDGFWLVGTDMGPYYLDEKFREFRPLMTELPRDPDACKNMGVWGLAGPGVVIPLGRSLRVSRALKGQSIGPETFEVNTSPVQGRVTSWCSSERWGYFGVKNALDDDVWVCAVRPRQVGDWHGNPFSWYPLFKLTDVDSEAAFYLGTEGGRTLPTVLFGNDDDVTWFSEGRTTRFPDDTSYTYASSGTAYLTELRRQPDALKVVKFVEIKATGLSADETVTVKISADGRTSEQVGSVLNATTSKSGWHHIPVHDVEGVFIRPEIVLARGSTNTNTPKVVGKLRIGYDLKDWS